MPADKSRLDRLVALSRAALAWESFWRALTGVAAVLALFLACSWFGLWTWAPAAARPVGLLIFLVLALCPIAIELRQSRLDRRAAIARIDRSVKDVHGIASALVDEPANAGGDQTTAALWRLHVARLESKLHDVRIAPPSPRATDVDRFALRAGALLLALVGAIVAGPERSARIMTAFVWNAASAPLASGRVDAWIDPPPYTGKPPVVLTGRAAAEGSAADGSRVSAPAGSTIVIRASDSSLLDYKASGGLEPAAEPEGQNASRNREFSKKLVLKGDARLSVAGRSFEISAVPDKPPGVELLEQPRANLRGSLTLSYRTEDDYGVIGAEARFASPEIDGRVVTGPTLVDPPRMPLTLPPGPAGLGEGKSTLDFSDHPWAGAKAVMTLHVRDEGGNEGASAPIAIYLPARNFSNPLARSLAEQRRNLVLAPDRRGRVLSSLQALMIEPELFGVGAGVYLGLHTAAGRLKQARTDSDLRDVADLLWSMALQIEDGGHSDAEKEMRAAEQALRDALQRNASEDEIRKLTDALRSAMDKFLSEMAQRLQREDRQAEPTPNGRSRSVSRDELRNMLDRMEQMARNGDMAEAQQMLDQLQNMLENLKTARRGTSRDRENREMNNALGDLDRLMRDQQQLRDDSYRDGRKAEGDRDQSGRRSGRDQRDQNGRRPQDGDGLQQRQSELGRRLSDLQRKLSRSGGPSQKSLEAAREAMKEAGSELGQGGDRDKAVDAQGRAIEAMRNGAEQLAKQMQGQPSDQAGEGEGPQMGEADGEAPPEADPLGRPSTRDPRYNPRARYDPLGASPALRAQRVLEELRRRLGDVSRPQEELDYLERLIRRY